MCPLKIRLFGKFSVLYNDRELESFQSAFATCTMMTTVTKTPATGKRCDS